MLLEKFDFEEKSNVPVLLWRIEPAFGNTKLAPLTRGQARRSNERSDNYIYAITIDEVKIEGYKKPDPFTKAVIKLLKPQAPATSDL